MASVFSSLAIYIDDPVRRDLDLADIELCAEAMYDLDASVAMAEIIDNTVVRIGRSLQMLVGYAQSVNGVMVTMTPDGLSLPHVSYSAGPAVALGDSVIAGR